MENIQIISLLLNLPLEMLDAILKKILTQGSLKEAALSLSFLSRSCSSLGFFQLELNKIGARKLVQHIADGELDEAKKMLDVNPYLLLFEVEIRNKARQRIRATGFRCALGALDSIMWKMIEPFFAKLENGDEEKRKQINEQFPPSYDENEYEQFDFKTLIDAIITEQQNNQVTNEALKAFREHFTPKETNVITTGKYFDMQIYIDAIKIYHENFKLFNNWEERFLYCVTVEGVLQLLFPACYAQAFCQGLHNLAKHDESLIRSLQLKSGSSFYSPHLGDRYYVGLHGWKMKVGAPASRPLLIEEIHRRNIAELTKIIQYARNGISISKSTKPYCVMF